MLVIMRLVVVGGCPRVGGRLLAGRPLVVAVGGRAVVVAERRLLVVAGCPPVAAAAGLPLAGRPA